MSRLKKTVATSNVRFKCQDCPYSTPHIDHNSLSPAFSIKNLQKGYGLEECDDKQKLALLEFMRRRSSMVWLDFFKSDRHGLGCEKIDQNAIKAPIPSIIKTDTTLLAFRFHGTAPLVGFRDKEIFHILWLDINYELYKH